MIFQKKIYIYKMNTINKQVLSDKSGNDNKAIEFVS